MRIFCISILLFLELSGQAQYSKIHDFITENDVRYPRGELLSDGTWLYFATARGPVYSQGAIWKIRPDGSDLTNLINFNGTNGDDPEADLTLSGSVIYGSTTAGGIYNNGVLFSINTDGTGYKKLFDFDGTNGTWPLSGLIVSGSVLYGMTYKGGTNDYGVAFKINNDGTGFTKLFDFEGITNGARPAQRFTISGTTLYGTTSEGGTSNKGVIFRIETDGSGFSKILDFNDSNGARPWSPLILSGTTLYGSTWFGGTNGNGVVFKMNVNGTSFEKIVDFNGSVYGAGPRGLSVSGSNIYGTTYGGGSKDRGVVFKINLSTGIYTKLLEFTGLNGINPIGSIIQSGAKLYGSTEFGGHGFGTIFSINDDGSNYVKLLDCAKAPMGSSPDRSNFVSDGTWLYGTTKSGGLGNGTIYKIKPDGTEFTKLYEFDDVNGDGPTGLVLSGSVLYGTAGWGGAHGGGTFFKISTTGTGFTKILDFDGTGSVPNKLNLVGSTFYGTTYSGGTYNLGVIYKLNIDGTGFTKLFDFDGPNYGSGPNSELVLSGTKLYGTTINGGLEDKGVIFRIDTDGSGFSKMVDFTGSNGSHPYSALTLNGTILYGTTSDGGSNNLGTIFKINTDGTNFSRIYDFDGVTNGAWPIGSLAFAGTKLFGIAEWGGSSYGGVLYRINTNGENYIKLYEFTSYGDGRRSMATPFILNEALYAQTDEGGPNQLGTIFRYDLRPAGADVIDGPASVCRGRTDITYSVAPVTNADSYVWTLPSGATGSSNTNSINVSFNQGSVSGDITVKGTNSFGEGSLSTKAITVAGIIPEIKTKWKNVLLCYDLDGVIDYYQWYKDGLPVSKANKQYYYTSGVPGVYKVQTTDKDICINFSNSISISAEQQTLEIYPNPVSESFKLKTGEESEGRVLVTILNTSGFKVAEFDSAKESLENIPVSSLENGVYIVKVLLSNGKLFYNRIVVMK